MIATRALLAAAALAASATAAPPLEVFVDPRAGDDALLGSQISSAAVRTVHGARLRVRELLAAHAGRDVTVQLAPGLHHVGDQPLALGPQDGGAHGSVVTWRSADPRLPAMVGAPIAIKGWKPHPTVKDAMVAPLPANVTKGSALRQLWVGGQRAQRTRLYGHGRQQGDNRNGYCHNLTNSTPTALYPAGSAYDFSGENVTTQAICRCFCFLVTV
jgi:hypothetical protein